METSNLLLEPLTVQPAVEEVQGRLRLVVRHHVAGLVDAHEREVAGGLDGAVALLLKESIGDRAAASELQSLSLGLVESILAVPLKSLSPGLVAEPVADEVSIAGVDQDRDLGQDIGQKAVEGLHPVTLEQEVAVNIEVAAVVVVDFGADGLLHIITVQVLGDPAHLGVAQVAAVLAGATDVVDIATSALVRAEHGVVAVDSSRNTAPDALRLVAALDEGLAAGQSVVHGTALGLVKNGRPATVTAGHGAVLLVLGVRVGQTVANQDRLEVDVAVLVGQNLVGKDGDVVTSVGLASNVEVLLGVLGELLEEQGQEGVNVLAGSNGVADGLARVRVADVDGLVKEDHGRIGVPRQRVVDDLDVLVDSRGTKLEEQTGQRRAAGAAVQPQDDGIVLGIVAGLEEPCDWLVNDKASMNNTKNTKRTYSRTDACRSPRHQGSHCTA